MSNINKTAFDHRVRKLYNMDFGKDGPTAISEVTLKFNRDAVSNHYVASVDVYIPPGSDALSNPSLRGFGGTETFRTIASTPEVAISKLMEAIRKKYPEPQPPLTITELCALIYGMMSNRGGTYIAYVDYRRNEYPEYYCEDNSEWRAFARMRRKSHDSCLPDEHVGSFTSLGKTPEQALERLAKKVEAYIKGRSS